MSGKMGLAALFGERNPKDREVSHGWFGSDSHTRKVLNRNGL